jgi:PAS domain S-box-containing protein
LLHSRAGLYVVSSNGPPRKPCSYCKKWGGETTKTTLDLSPFQRLHQLEALYQDAPVGLCFIDCQMRIVSANQLLTRYPGMELDSILRKPASQVFGDEMMPDLMTALVQLMAGESCETREYCYQPSGAAFLVAHQRIVYAQQLPLGVSLVLVDITSRVEAERQLQQSETHFRTVLELGPNVIWRVGPDGQVNYMGEFID